MIYWELFLSFLQVGLFSFGGGYAAMPLIRGQVVTVHHWLSMSEFTDLITISQMTPGPIAVNSATFVGTKIAGTLGALVATFGCILPSCIIVTVIARLYLEYGCFARNIEFSKTSSGGDDCSGWHINSDYSFLGEYRNDIAGWNKMDSCCNFYDMCCIITEGKNESNRGYGFGRHYEGWNIIYWRIG